MKKNFRSKLSNLWIKSFQETCLIEKKCKAIILKKKLNQIDEFLEMFQIFKI